MFNTARGASALSQAEFNVDSIKSITVSEARPPPRSPALRRLLCRLLSPARERQLTPPFHCAPRRAQEHKNTPPPRLNVLSISLKTVFNEQKNHNEIVMARCSSLDILKGNLSHPL